MESLWQIMNRSPDRVELKKCLDDLASAMNLEQMAEELSLSVIDHVLYDLELNGIRGKNGWECCAKGLITERELRNLTMAHAVSKISRSNGVKEPAFNTYASKHLCEAFERSLLGRPAILKESDVLDPWEKK
ncbi:hypothetical protein BTA51_13890 [Hahella sp. CCB-MM4]|uniref:hypothetical protein n=1 Tax=Hahella sp. (strain CCB-MM4) TaxID=1926491 RepID=UPI000BD11208|nr:hypothetical protein [Hahella sp. CCB-MM4]OZG72616.1 hypothetical protein BTA51_13890 [Hahella sp. CCB-MM4]